MIHLRMYGCGIARIETGAFNKMPLLSTLVLNSNSLTSLPTGLFRQSKNIKSLFLDRNNLTSVPDLRGISKMARLVLSKNNIKQFNATELGVNKIAVLQVSSCHMETFSLKGIRLFELDFSHNNIVKLEDFSFRGLKRIKTFPCKTTISTRHIS